jgi:hypothetical protein
LEEKAGSSHLTGAAGSAWYRRWLIS